MRELGGVSMLCPDRDLGFMVYIFVKTQGMCPEKYSISFYVNFT